MLVLSRTCFYRKWKIGNYADRILNCDKFLKHVILHLSFESIAKVGAFTMRIACSMVTPWQTLNYVTVESDITRTSTGE